MTWWMLFPSTRFQERGASLPHRCSPDGRYSPGAVGLLYGGDGRLLAASLVLICAIVAWSVIIGGIGLMIAKRLGILTIPTDLQRFGSDVAHSLLGAPPPHVRVARVRPLRVST